jgi:hypothetical protein
MGGVAGRGGALVRATVACERWGDCMMNHVIERKITRGLNPAFFCAMRLSTFLLLPTRSNAARRTKSMQGKKPLPRGSPERNDCLKLVDKESTTALLGR